MSKTVIALAAALASMWALPAAARESDAQVRQRLIKESIGSYPGNCPCPYNSASNGSRCGGRSAYSRGGGYAPVCFASDISEAEVARARR